jgi:peptide/nickel transport system substrate-binding protein
LVACYEIVAKFIGAKHVRGAYRNDRVNAEFGDAGPSLINAPAFATLESKGSDQITVKINPFQIERMNYFLLSTNSGNPLWSNLVHTPLLYYDKNLELQNGLASSFEEGEDGKQFTFELKQDATFSNGDPVTAEDVKFTFEMINRNADKGFPYPSKIPYEAIEAIDERTIQFRLEESYAAFITRTIPRWGVLHPPSWDGVNDAPTEFDPNVDNYVNTGPFEVQALEGRQLLALEPRDEDHPLFNPDYQLLFQAFEKTSTAIEGMISGNIDIITNMSTGGGERLSDSQVSENITLESGLKFTPDPLYPQFSWGPCQFKGFREALGKALNYQEINEVARNGESEPDLYAVPLMKSHPFRPPDDEINKIVDDPTGNIDAARQVLKENGWGWDDQGNLHYPPDADPSPMWPEGEGPTSEESNGGFSCLNEEGEWVGE